MSQGTFKLLVLIWAEKRSICLSPHNYFFMGPLLISLWLCFAALFLHVQPMLRFLLSSLWHRKMHQSETLASNYPPLTVRCQAGTCLFICGWHWWLIQRVLFFFYFSVYCRLSSLSTGRRSKDIKLTVIIPIVSVEARTDAWKSHPPVLYRGTPQDLGLSTIMNILLHL